MAAELAFGRMGAQLCIQSSCTSAQSFALDFSEFGLLACWWVAKWRTLSVDLGSGGWETLDKVGTTPSATKQMET